MKTSIFFLGVFTAGLLTGMELDWRSWFYGLATGVSMYGDKQAAQKFLDDNQ